jgi:hypothetical protein
MEDALKYILGEDSKNVNFMIQDKELIETLKYAEGQFKFRDISLAYSRVTLIKKIDSSEDSPLKVSYINKFKDNFHTFMP